MLEPKVDATDVGFLVVSKTIEETLATLMVEKKVDILVLMVDDWFAGVVLDFLIEPELSGPGVLEDDTGSIIILCSLGCSVTFGLIDGVTSPGNEVDLKLSAAEATLLVLLEGENSKLPDKPIELEGTVSKIETVVVNDFNLIELSIILSVCSINLE